MMRATGTPRACAALGFLATLWRLPGGANSTAANAATTTHALPPPSADAARVEVDSGQVSGHAPTAPAPPVSRFDDLHKAMRAYTVALVERREETLDLFGQQCSGRNLER